MTNQNNSTDVEYINLVPTYPVTLEEFSRIFHNMIRFDTSPEATLWKEIEEAKKNSIPAQYVYEAKQRGIPLDEFLLIKEKELRSPKMIRYRQKVWALDDLEEDLDKKEQGRREEKDPIKEIALKTLISDLKKDIAIVKKEISVIEGGSESPQTVSVENEHPKTKLLKGLARTIKTKKGNEITAPSAWDFIPEVNEILNFVNIEKGYLSSTNSPTYQTSAQLQMKDPLTNEDLGKPVSYKTFERRWNEVKKEP